MDDAASLLEIPSFKPKKVTRIGVTLCKPEVKLLLMLTIDKILFLRKAKPMQDAFSAWKLNARVASLHSKLKLELRRRDIDAQESSTVLKYAEEMEEKNRQVNAELVALKQCMQEMKETSEHEREVQAILLAKEMEEVMRLHTTIPHRLCSIPHTLTRHYSHYTHHLICITLYASPYASPYTYHLTDQHRVCPRGSTRSAGTRPGDAGNAGGGGR
jgi:hypothetical protein